MTAPQHPPAAPAVLAVATPEPPAHHVSTKLLAALYLIVPLSMAFVGVDLLFLGGRMGAKLPFMPEQLFLFALFFEMPHIFGSSILLVDKEYLQHYGKRLLIGGVCVLAAVLAGIELVGEVVLMAGAAAYTMYHVVSQQCGIAKMMIGKTDSTYALWRLFGIVSGTAVFFATFLTSEREVLLAQYGFDLVGGVSAFGALTTAAVLFLSFRLWKSCTRPVGRMFLLGHGLMVLSCLGCHFLKYSFFVLLMPRVVHDLTAFAFYVTHDRNRNAKRRINVFQKVGGWLRLPVWLVTPIAAFLLAIPVTQYAINSDRYLWIYFFLSTFHFFTESFTWQSASPHKAHIRLG